MQKNTIIIITKYNNYILILEPKKNPGQVPVLRVILKTGAGPGVFFWGLLPGISPGNTNCHVSRRKPSITDRKQTTV